MKKLFTLILISGLLFTACNKDDDDPAEKFSTQTVEENKAFVEESGIEFVGAMQRMESLETIGVLKSFGDLNSSIGSKGLLANNSKLSATFDALTACASGNGKFNQVFDAMMNPRELKIEDPESLQEFWNQNLGTYTWNSSLNDWDKTSGGNKIIFQFPSSESSSTNDAILTFSNYAGVSISNPVEEDYTGDLPTTLNVELKVGTEVLVTYVFGATYNSDGVPGSVASDLTIESFKFEIDLTNNSSEVSVNYKLLENDNTVLDLGAAGKGDFTEANYDANTETFTETYTYTDYVYNPATQQWEVVEYDYTEEWNETDFEEILNSANAHFQLFDIALRGDIDVKGLVDQIELLDADEDIEEEDYYDGVAEQINEFLNLRLVNVSNNEIIAKAEAYVVEEAWYDVTDYYIDFRLTFGDGSPIDMQTYFENGFDDFVDEINELINDINADYDAGLEPIDY